MTVGSDATQWQLTWAKQFIAPTIAHVGASTWRSMKAGVKRPTSRMTQSSIFLPKGLPGPYPVAVTGQDRAMKLVLAFYGTRGDVEPGVAVGRELVRRGHDVRIAVPPDLIAFAEAAGLTAVAYGPDNQAWL